ncbi:MAG: hypothetical protein WDO71_08935 [Bacteroidota bacterium]
MAVKNAGTLEKIGLSGLVAPGNTADTTIAEDTNVSFRKKEEINLTPEQLSYLSVLQQLDAAFEKPQLETVMAIITRFTEDPPQLKVIADLLNIQTS